MTQHTILVVDDNRATREMASVALLHRGHRVLNAADGQSALMLMEREQPVLVLQDVVLPDFDGVVLAGELRKRAREPLVVLAFSRFTSRTQEARISAGEFNDVIIKPVEPWRLVSLVEAHLPPAVPQGDLFGAGKRVMVADDDPIQLTLMRHRLSRLGFAVETAGNGEDALARMSANPPDMVISDVFMPRLDGFGLSLAMRKDPRLAQVPLLLVTSGYLDSADRELARQAGADDLLLRTTDQREVIGALRALVASGPLDPNKGAPPLGMLEHRRGGGESEGSDRIVVRLERQVAFYGGLAHRCKAMSVELAVLEGASRALLKEENFEAVTDAVLSSCLDASGVAAGALYLSQTDGNFRARPLGRGQDWKASERDSFFGEVDLLRTLIAAGATVRIPSSALPFERMDAFLRRCGGTAALLVPITDQDHHLGALLMVAHGQELDGGEGEDWQLFGRGLAHQVSQALALSKAFARRDQAEREAQAARAEWQLLAEQAPDVIVRVDRAGIVEFVNHVLPPRRPEDVVGNHWLAEVPPQYHESLSDALRVVLSSGKSSAFEVMLPTADGKAEWFSTNIGPVTRGGVITGAILISRHVTRKKEEEAQLIVADRMASVGTLAAGVAHEINNPLAALIANLDLAHRDASEMVPSARNKDLMEYLQDAQEAAERVRLIVRDLKVFSRIEEDRTGPTEVRTVLESTLRMAWNEIRHRARLVKEFGDTPPVEANEARLGQVFLNLVINATHAIAEGQAHRNEIRVSTGVDPEGMVRIQVMDTGVGMTDDLKKRLFTPFFTTKPTGVGTGLGLAVCQKLVAAMGGSIQVDSELGRGSTFTVLLPPMHVATAPVEPAPSAPAPAPRRRGRVLVIDDEEVVATAIRRALSKQNDVIYAPTAQQALETLKTDGPFDVILCDLMMPEMTGMDLHAELVASAPEYAERMIFVTGGAFTARARAFLTSVANTRIEKPFNIHQLRALVNERVR